MIWLKEIVYQHRKMLIHRIYFEVTDIQSRHIQTLQYMMLMNN